MMDKLKILIVEDDLRIQKIYEAGLSGEVFDKHFVVNGKDALREYRIWEPDIIVLDIMLPELSGYSVLKEIRKSVQDTTTAIIMASAVSGRDDIIDCVKLGIHGYIVKPFSYRDIGHKILDYYKPIDQARAEAAQAMLIANAAAKFKSR
jgi:DNA-binding response OmpR family regulator